MVNPNVHIVSDWDAVQYDTPRLKQEIFGKASEVSGLDLDTIKLLYEQTKDADGYNDVALAQAIAAESFGLNPEEILRFLRAKLENRPDLMYPDALQFNKDVSPLHPISIFTAGSAEGQRRKIDGSGQRHFFTEVQHFQNQGVEENKTAALIAKLEKISSEVEDPIIVSIDDQMSTILHQHEVLRDFPQIIPILLDRSDQYKPDAPLTWHELSLDNLNRTLAIVGKKRPLIIGVQYDNGHPTLVAEKEY